MAVGVMTTGATAVPTLAGATPTRALAPIPRATPMAAGLAPCYTAGATGGVPLIPVALSGGTPGDAFQLLVSAHGGRSGGLGSASGSFDAKGSAAVTLTDIFPPRTGEHPTAGQRADLSVKDLAPGGAVTRTPLRSILITRRALDLGFSGRGDNRAHWVSLSGTQFAGQRIYGFIVRHNLVVRHMYLGRANVCGYTRAKETITPRHTAPGSYVFYANAGPTLDRRAAVSTAYEVELTVQHTAAGGKEKR